MSIKAPAKNPAKHVTCVKVKPGYSNSNKDIEIRYIDTKTEETSFGPSLMKLLGADELGIESWRALHIFSVHCAPKPTGKTGNLSRTVWFAIISSRQNAYLGLILTNGVLEQLSEDAGPLLLVGCAAHAPQALRAGKFSTDCAQGL
ncbi:hypothetical protein Y032_0316g2278 [Ancylostoma ceylanicum]|uniref:Uncharacterized protein n=1 Tax=Ancylostoma ceylanicum TaxID=53326 RepID=A0A016S196_9BILA|nr:hypothetical protein Y032_0316g2278 [Ancylostoma ceylanicum]